MLIITDKPLDLIVTPLIQEEVPISSLKLQFIPQMHYLMRIAILPFTLTLIKRSMICTVSMSEQIIATATHR